MFFCLVFVIPLCVSVYLCLVFNCWEWAGLLALVCGVSLLVSHFPIGILGQVCYLIVSIPCLEVIKLEFILRLKIKHYDWLLADTCPKAANHCAIF